MADDVKVLDGNGLHVGTVSFSNGVKLVIPSTSDKAPTVNGTPVAIGKDDVSNAFYVFGDAVFGGMTMKKSNYNTALFPSASADVSSGGYKVMALGSWIMVGGWINFKDISKGSAPTYTFNLPLGEWGSNIFKSAPAICIQEQYGGNWYEGENFRNVTTAQCQYVPGSSVLTMTISRNSSEALSLLFFVFGSIA